LLQLLVESVFLLRLFLFFERISCAQKKDLLHLKAGWAMLDSSLSQGLGDGGRRRLWLLELLISKLEPSAALYLAVKMESFVRGDSFGIIPEAGEAAGSVAESSNRSAGAPPSEAPYVSAEPEAPSAAETLAEGRGSRLLHGKALQDFTDALGAGADNTELARRFRMTPRQANGLRMGIQKRLPHLRMAKVAKPKKVKLDRSTELQMQEAFLSTKPEAATTLDDVVRFLRQRGDVVVRSENNFLVNRHRTMTPAELVARANAKRSEMRLPAFRCVWSVAAVVPHEGAQSTAVPPEILSRTGS
jgi:hypothetical protein